MANDNKNKKTTPKGHLEKKNELIKITDVFVADDMKNILADVFQERVVPIIKNGLFDIGNYFLGRTLFGQSSSPNKQYDYRSGKTDYSTKKGSGSYSYQNRNESHNEPTTKDDVIRNMSYNDVFFTTRGEAEEILDDLIDLIEANGFATVFDFFDDAHITCDYTLDNYGWEDLRRAEVIYGRSGYKIKFPRAIALKRKG